MARPNFRQGSVHVINDRPEAQEIFGGLHLEEVRLKYTISDRAATDAAELIITNREIATRLL